eukprot:2143961-Pyramimonas_sp.AAC.1
MCLATLPLTSAKLAFHGIPVVSRMSAALVSDKFARTTSNFATVLTSSPAARSSEICPLLGGASAAALASPRRFRPRLGVARKDMAAPIFGG